LECSSSSPPKSSPPFSLPSCSSLPLLYRDTTLSTVEQTTSIPYDWAAEHLVDQMPIPVGDGFYVTMTSHKQIVTRHKQIIVTSHMQIMASHKPDRCNGFSSLTHQVLDLRKYSQLQTSKKDCAASDTETNMPCNHLVQILRCVPFA